MLGTARWWVGLCVAGLSLGAFAGCGGDGGAASGNGGSGGSSAAGNGGTAGSGGVAGSGGTAGTGAGGSGAGGSGGWAPTECNSGDVTDCYTGLDGTQHIGSCRSGLQQCVAGKYSETCDGEVLPATEICNGLDDDCDGEVDEGCSCTEGNTQECYSGPPGTQGVAACRSGMQTCEAAGIWSPICDGEVAPSVETCNGVDDDCNGVIDDVTSVRLYRLAFPANTWSSQPLREAWTGPNAPTPCTEISAVLFAHDFNQLMVFTSSGQLHMRVGSTWQAPVPASSRFQGLPVVLDTVFQLPWAWTGTPHVETHITFSSSPHAPYYEYRGQPMAQTLLLSLNPSANGPPRPNIRDNWSFERLDPDLNDTTFGILVSSLDGKLYHMNKSTQWTKWDNPATHPYFAAPGAPDANRCSDAWFDMPAQVAYFICR
ncbi:MAG: putative metal-binding motif-containing protein [Polyangiaceae bacterium]|nr:putative metal-binding motif-containing protein [Polyangiaceae bacterium]MCW5788796.1 putative metal-binding motif-containing protein [Polyangiaceae bacterium]